MKTDGWFDFSDFYDYIVKQFHSGLFIEIGTWKGKSISFLAKKVLDSRKDIRIVGIDTFEGTEEDYMLLNDEDLPTLYDVYLQTIEPYKDIITTIVGSSHDVHTQFEDQSIDFLFIDGDHRYKSIKKDLELWLPKVKKGGIISGHDYESSATCGVKDAVDQTFNSIKIMGRCWYTRV